MATSANGILQGGRKICDIPIRVLLRESHNLSQTLTRHPTENGKNISDHVISNPNSVDVEFEMTNTDGGRGVAKETFLLFVQLMEEKKPVNLYTEHASYKNMVCVSFTPDHSAPNRGAYRATARLEQAGFVGEKGTVYAAKTQAQGGRDESVLAGSPSQLGRSESPPKNRDVLYRTAVAPRNDGVVEKVDNPALDKKILNCLKSYSNGTYKPSRRK